MTINYDKSTRRFHLNAYQTSLVLEISEEGYLLNRYFGSRIKTYRESNKTQEIDRSFSPGPYSDNRGFSLDTKELLYSAWGLGDFRTPAFEIANEQNNVTNLRYTSHTIAQGKKELRGLPASHGNKEDCTTLKLTMTDTLLDLNVHLFLTAFHQHSVIASHVEFENGDKETLILNKAMSFMLDLPDSDYQKIELVGAYAREKTVQRTPLRQGYSAINSRRGASGHASTPYAALVTPTTTETEGEVISLHLVYSGDFEISTFVDQLGKTRFSTGLNSETFNWQLEKGGKFVTPEALLMFTNKGLGGMTHDSHDFVKKHILRGNFQNELRPILLNNWEATYFDFNEEKILKLADKAVETGIELLVLDDGWFGNRFDDNRALGDWDANQEKLPNGIEGLAKKVTERGLKFGIWVEPEMISENSDLYRAHPDWCLRLPNRQHTYSRNQLVLDLSKPDVCQYVIESMKKTFESKHISYLKWDMNRNMTNIPQNTNQQGSKETSHRYMLGLYAILAELTTKFPNILFESCSGGGGRFDLGMLVYMPQTWTSDNTDAISRLNIQYGTGLIYPAVTMGAHVSAIPNHQVGRLTPLETRSNVAMAGNFGYELDLTQLSNDELLLIKEQVAFYKIIRPLVQQGDLYRLLSPDTSPNEVAYCYVDKSKTQIVATYIKTLAVAESPIRTLKLAGLDPELLYRNTQTNEVFGGDELMNVGFYIPNVAQDFYSYLVYFEQV